MIDNNKLDELSKNIDINNEEVIDRIISVDISKLTENEQNDIYQINDLEKFEESIKINGQLEPITITKDYKIISGHRRYIALKNLGEKQAKCIIKTYDSKLEEELDLIEYNSQRRKSKEERNAEIRRKKEIYTDLKKQGIEKYQYININKLLAEEFNVGETTIKNTIKPKGNAEITNKKDITELEKYENYCKNIKKQYDNILKLDLEISPEFEQIMNEVINIINQLYE